LAKRRPEAQSGISLTPVSGLRTHLCDAFTALEALCRLAMRPNRVRV
jgi:hypothetical protein